MQFCGVAPFLFSQYIAPMLWRSSRGRLLNAPAAFIHPCQPTVAKQPPSGPGWAHELKHDGYRLQIHIRDGRIRLYTINGYDWSNRYPLIVEEATRINVTAIIDAEVICTDGKGVPTFETLHSRCNDHLAFACAFDLLMVGGEDLRPLSLAQRKAALRKLLKADRGGIQYVEHAQGPATNCLLRLVNLAWRASSPRSSTRRTSPGHQRRG
jgi:bifunctional non-homologous end joining protein LigD